MTTLMWRALTLKQPWAWAICHAGKDVENRSWPIPPKLMFGGREPHEGLGCEPLRVMLHAGAAWDETAIKPINYECGRPHFRALKETNHSVWNGRFAMGGFIDGVGVNLRQPFGAVVAVVELTGCHKAQEGDCHHVGSSAGGTGAVCSPWAVNDDDMWHWEIGAVYVLDDPVPAKGRQRPWFPDEDLVAGIVIRS